MSVLVTGGGGFLGGAIIARLLERGIEVRSLARGGYPELAKRGVETRQGDLADATVVTEAVDGCEAVFHVAAKAGMWGRYADYHRTNVEGTRNIIEACRRRAVGKLIYTSTPSVVQRETDIEGADESLPYPDKHTTHYQQTKAIAERALAAGVNEVIFDRGSYKYHGRVKALADAARESGLNF